ncbi:PE family protein, partial [Mycobacterium asiaticum]|uniref:PE family protein n=1 Tax=Mycobacterium asiaticum TaxID=1790 RepID=UPI0009BF0C3F
MSYVIVESELLSAAAANVEGIGAAITMADAAAAAPTTGLAALGVDEISAAINGFLSLQAREYQTLSAQLAAFFNARFVQALSAGAQWYASTEAAIAASLRNAEQQLQGVVSLLTGRAAPSTPSNTTPTEPTPPTQP